MPTKERGFSLVELTVALGLSLVVTAAVFAALQPSRGWFEAEAERSDLEQRLRVAADTIGRDLAIAGAGASVGAGAGSLVRYFAPVLPYEPGGTPAAFRSDLIWIVYVPDGAAQTTAANAVVAGPGSIVLRADPGCAVADPACGFREGATVLVFDPTGARDLFAVEAVTAATLTVRHLTADTPRVYAAGSKVVEAIARSYFLDHDPEGGGDRLLRRDAGGAALPVVDHVAALSFAYYGDPNPPRLIAAPASPAPPWERRTTYGPAPDPATAQAGYPAGENCAFRIDPDSGTPSARLATLDGAGPDGLVELGASALTDGPWCPDAAAANRFDADLLRVRRIGVTIRIESALAPLRGAAGEWFRRGGSATSPSSLVPDRVARFDIAARNLEVP